MTIAGQGSLVRTGWPFTGWNTNADGSGINYAEGASYTIDAALTLYAKWTAVDYVITWHLNGGVNGANPASYTINSPQILFLDFPASCVPLPVITPLYC